MVAKKTKEVLQKITDEINSEYGFHDGIPRINYGLCAFSPKFFSKSGMSFSKIRFINLSLLLNNRN